MSWPRLRGIPSAIIFIICSLYSAHSLAHKLAPSLLQIDEVETGVYRVIWRTPAYAQTSPVPVLPDSCREEGVSTALVGTAIERQWVAHCAKGIEGKILKVDLLGASRTVAMLRFQPADGKLQQRILTPDADSYQVPDHDSAGSVFGEYVRLGIKHILLGTDHLFFVTGLLLLAGSLRTLLKTVTAFTLGHSVTLALVSLDLVPQWPALVEFLIATTILILALELSGPAEVNERHYIRRHQWLMASGFGLIHGFGFAGVLKDIGIPHRDLISALLAFNVGIEVGQLLFVSVLASLFYGMRLASARGYRLVRSILITLMGGFSAYWCLDRGTEMLRQLL